MIRSVCLMRCSYKTLQKLKYLGNMNTHVVLFYRLSFCVSFFPNKCPSLKKNLSTTWIFVILWQILKRFALISEEWMPSTCQILVFSDVDANISFTSSVQILFYILCMYSETIHSRSSTSSTFWLSQSKFKIQFVRSILLVASSSHSCIVD